MSAKEIVCVNAVTTQAFWQLPRPFEDRLRARVSARGGELIVARTLPELASALRGAQIVVGWPFPKVMARGAVSLRRIHFFTSGVPESWAGEDPSPLRITTHGHASATAVAQHALFLTLAALRGVRRSTFAAWVSDDYDTPLSPETMRAAVFGFGGVGRALAPLLAPLCAGVTALARRIPSDLPLGISFAVASDWERVLADSRIVVLALPLSPATRALVGSAFFGALAPGTTVVNVASGTLVDEHHVLEFLDRSPLNRYASDVAHPEPYPQDGALFLHDRVILTPHVGARREDAWAKIEAGTLRSLDDALRVAP